MRRSLLLLSLASFTTVTAGCGADAPPPQAPAPAAPPVASASASAASGPAQPVTVRRVLVMDTRPSGSSVATTAPDGTVTIAFDMHANGRGPHVDATLHLSSDGTLASLDAHGHHEVGAPLDESFAIDAGHARWKSREETGDTAVTAPAFYMPVAEMPDTIGLLSQALLKAGGTLALLPDGQAHIEKRGEATVTAAGASKHLTAYDLTGFTLTPVHTWMEDDGSWFGSVDPGFSVVPEGWEGVIEPLSKQQLQFDRDRDARYAQGLAHRPAAGLAFTHARVLDVERGRWLADQTVVVVGDTIRSVGPSKGAKVPAGAEVVDLGGKALMPGLWDMHAHLSPPDGALNIGAGVTTARDVGNDPDRLDDFKQRFDDGSAIGPHVLRAGFIEGRGPDAAPSKVTAETPEEAAAGVEFYAKRGYDMIKIYNSVKPELIPVITKAAHAHGMTVTGHIPVHVLANEAVRAGYDGIEHVNMLFLNFLATHDTETRTPLRFSLVGDRAADLDLSSKPVQDFFALLREHRTVIDPTLDTFESLYVAQQGKVAAGTEWLVARLPVQERRRFLQGGLPHEGRDALYARSWERMVSIVKALRDAKVTTVVGTDELAGLMLDHELELFVKGGLSPAEALQDATIVPARAMKLEKKSGSIAAGKAADLVVVDGDPLANVADVRNVVTTVRGGVVYPAKDVLATVGVAYWQ
jgi:hypothetical protein